MPPLFCINVKIKHFCVEIYRFQVVISISAIFFALKSPEIFGIIIVKGEFYGSNYQKQIISKTTRLL